MGKFPEVVHSPLFALDALGVLPLYARFSIDLDKAKRSKVLRDSIITAFLVTVVFITVGNKVLHYLNVSIYDFLIAGGVILFIISARDLLGGGREELAGQEDLFEVVPLGVPMLAGPAVLTTSLIIFNSFVLFYALGALLLNLLIAGMIFKYSVLILRLCQPQVGRGHIEGIYTAPRKHRDHVHPYRP